MNDLVRLSIVLLVLIPVFVSPNALILSDYIKQNRLTEAKSLSEVKGLPNAPKIKSYSGFLTVDHKYNSNLFFWFFPSFKNSVRAPVVIWLEGGPGASSIWSLFTLNGPYRVDKNLIVSLNPYSLTQEFSVLYIDNPVGTGYSFTDNDKGFSSDMNSVADNLYIFLQQFYEIFSEYRNNELYIAGESYAGKYVPAIGYKLMQMSNESKIYFKGIAIGNGYTDPINQLDGFVYLKSTGLIDEKQQDELKLLENKVREYYNAKDYVKASEYSGKLFSTRRLNSAESSGSYASNATGYMYYYNFILSGPEANGPEYFEKYLEQNETRKALHVPNVKFSVGNETVFKKLSKYGILSMMDNMTALIPDYKVMLFAGNLDMFLGPAQINAMLENKDWKYCKDFYSAKRVIWKVSDNDTEVAGYSKSFGKFMLVIVRNAGHSVAQDQPRSNLDMMRRFIYDLPFERNELDTQNFIKIVNQG